MAELNLPFVDRESRELAQVGRDTLSGSDWFWVQFFAIWITFGFFWAIDYYTGINPLGVDGVTWLLVGAFLAGGWAGAQKFWDDQKRHSPRLSSPGFEGTVANMVGMHIEPVKEMEKIAYPAMRVFSEGVSHLVHWTPSRGAKIIEREDGIWITNDKRIDSNTQSREVLWDELPKHVQEFCRTSRRKLKIRFKGRDYEKGQPVIGTRFVYGDKPMYAVFRDEPYAMDVSVEAQRAAESMSRSTAERVGARAVGLADTTSRITMTRAVREAKKRPLVQPQEDEVEREGFE